MTEITTLLSKRLLAIANQIPVGSLLADIGTDHALLPTYLVQQGISSFIVAGEFNPGPYRAACLQVEQAGFTSYIDVRRGNGLAVLNEGDAVDVITLSGMGGALIAQILSEGEAKLDGVSRLVLQPNVGEFFVRKWLRQSGWSLIHEQLIEEDGKWYEVLTAEKGDDRLLYEDERLSEHWLLRMGPFLTKEKSPLFFLKWQAEIGKLDRVIKQMTKSTSEETRTKRADIEAERDELKEVLQWLRMETR